MQYLGDHTTKRLETRAKNQAAAPASHGTGV